jgi:hypothetical protein
MSADDRAALEQLRQSSRRMGPHVVLHYLYFPHQQGAVAAAAEFRNSGFATEERLGADGINWLVLARHEIVPSEEAIARIRQVMEDLAGRYGGEYDGWEADA